MPARRPTVGEAVSWGVIVAVVVLAMLAQVAGRRHARKAAPPPATAPAPTATAPSTAPATFPAAAPATAPATSPALADLPIEPAPPPDAQFLTVARQAVGLKALVAEFPAARVAAGPESFAELRRQLSRFARRSVADRLRLVIVNAELAEQRPEQVVAALDDYLGAEPPPPPGLARDALDLRAVYAAAAAAAAASAPTAGPPQAPGGPALERLRERHGFFAELALVYGRPASDPQRRAALAGVRRAAIMLVAGGVVGVVAILAGVGLIVVAVVLYRQGRLRPLYRPDPAAPPFHLEAFAVYLAGFTVISIAAPLLVADASMGLTLLAAVPLVLALAWPALRGLRSPRSAEGFGLGRGRGVLKEVACGLLGYVAALPLLAIVLFVTARLVGQGEPVTHPIIEETREAGRSVGGVVMVYFLATVWAPVSEELMFRGAFFHHLRRRLGFWASAILVAILFAALHPQGLVAIPALSAIAVILAAIREWRGSIIAPVAAHAVNNAVIITLLVFTLA